jgi:hypothetical protein
MPDDNGDYDDVRPFAGLTRHSDTTLEEIPNVGGHGSSMRWWTADYFGMDDHDPVENLELPGEGFTTVVNRLPRATTATAGWKHPLTDEWVETDKHSAIVDPERVENLEVPAASQEGVREYIDGLDSQEFFNLAQRVMDDGDEIPSREEVAQAVMPGDGALYHIPTDSYQIINPGESLIPLAEVLREEEFGDSVFGEFRLTRGGGRVSGDLFLDGMHVNRPGLGDDEKPIVVGLELNYDFFGDSAFRARGVSLRTSCMNAMRGITEWQIVKHAGDIESRVDWKDWWTDLLEEIDLVRDHLSQVIQEASETFFELRSLPEDFDKGYDSRLEALYAYAGLPDYLAEHAAANCRQEAEDPFRPSWWDIHNGATYAVTHHARGEVMGGGSIEEYARLADEMLQNPARMEEVVTTQYDQHVHGDDEELEGEGGGHAEIAQAFESAREKKEQYEQRREEMNNLIAPAPDE